MKNAITILFILISLISYSQDFELYKRLTDDKVKLPQINQAVELNEFQLLSRDARMMDMAYAMIIPGYVHFKAKDKKMAYAILGTRIAGYGGLAYSYYQLKDQGEQIFEDIENEDNYQVKQNKIIGIASLTILISTYFFDWIHGKAVLEKKQEIIRYKYGFKVQMEGLSNGNSYYHQYPAVRFTYNF
ncbi:MAG: hypothetical protein B7C24_08585 [Bacteroidetes bacterium 4572_77]|nr:MAG: hypothetical protein B7C24_08585 [Bacteroidetes bacterium 4572_77]